MSQKTIREIAKVVKDRFTIHGCHPDKFVPIGFLEEYFEACLTEYLAQQEPFGYVRERVPGEWKFSKTSSWGPNVWKPVFLAHPIPAGMQLVSKSLVNELISALNEAAAGEFARLPLADELSGFAAMLTAAKEK